MENLELIFTAFAAMSGVMVSAVYWLMRRMDKVNAENDERHAIDIKERDATNSRLDGEITVLRNRIVELERSERQKTELLSTARDRVDELERNLNVVCTQLDEVNQRLNRKEEENNRKAEIITQQEAQIIRLESQIQNVNARLNEARLALSLIGRDQNKRESTEQPSTDDVTAAVAKVETELRAQQKTTDTPNQEG